MTELGGNEREEVMKGKLRNKSRQMMDKKTGEKMNE